MRIWRNVHKVKWWSGRMLNNKTTPKELAKKLGTHYKYIKFLYYEKELSNYYSTFQIAKKSGGYRAISAPNSTLSLLQSRLAQALSELYSPKDCVRGFVPGGSIKKNAQPHIRKKFVFNIDLENFFPSVTFPRIRGLLMAKPYELMPNTASIIAHLACLEGALPQGAPTSPIISNMICARLDRQLQKLAADNRSVYTRYADDMTFSFLGPAELLPADIVAVDRSSWRSYFQHAKVGVGLRKIIEDNGFSINEEKTRLQSHNRRQVVTGLIVNKKVNVDRRFVRKTSAMIHSVETGGVDWANEVFHRNFGDEAGLLENHIRGRLLFIKQIKGGEDGVFRKLAIRFNNLPTRQKISVSSRKSYSELGRSMNFKCWIIEVHAEKDGEYNCGQASGFLINDDVLITCAHLFSKYGDVQAVSAYQVNDREEKELEMLYLNDDYDIVALRFKEHRPKEKNFVDIRVATEVGHGEKVNMWGFPNFKPGHQGVSVTQAKVSNLCYISAVAFAEVDKDIYDGNSGGPVTNDDNGLVGIVAHGADDKTQHNAFIRMESVSKALGLAPKGVLGEKIESILDANKNRVTNVS